MNKKLIILIVMITMPLLSGSRALAAGQKPADNADGTVSETGEQNSESNSKGNRIIKEKDKLIIKNQKGKVIKEVSLERETLTETEKNWRGVKNKKLEKELQKNVVINKNGNYAAVIGNKRVVTIPEGNVTGQIKLLSADGKVLFEKSFPKDRWAHHEPLISDNAEHVVVFTGASEEVGVKGREIIYVLNKQGERILTFPTEEEYKNGYRAGNVQKISPNGRYLALYITQKLQSKPYKARRVTRFYDLKNNTFWDYENVLLIWDITNEGYGNVRDPSTRKTFKIDLKEHLDK